MNNTWALRFEMAEDFRHSESVGVVPPSALRWLESHWELLPRDGWQVVGTLSGGVGCPTVLREQDKCVHSRNGRLVVVHQSEMRETEVSWL